MAVELRSLTGRSSLAATVELLRRVRRLHPTAGVWEAADFEWWWRTPRPSDDWDRPFWFDNDGPIATAALTTWRSTVGLDVITLPGAPPDHVTDVHRTGLELAHQLDARHLEVMVDDTDAVAQSVLAGTGFAPTRERGTSAWMPAESRPPITATPPGYRLVSRAERRDVEHHYVARVGPDVEARLGQTSMYRADLDLAITDTSTGDVVADALFWFDPITHVGFVEPMGTDETHRRRGLARHLLTNGLDR
ncbi:MAG: hypothetical protein AAGA17_19580, partial [Actinomycetota bacterium]